MQRHARLPSTRDDAPQCAVLVRGGAGWTGRAGRRRYLRKLNVRQWQACWQRALCGGKWHRPAAGRKAQEAGYALSAGRSKERSERGDAQVFFYCLCHSQGLPR